MMFIYGEVFFYVEEHLDLEILEALRHLSVVQCFS